MIYLFIQDSSVCVILGLYWDIEKESGNYYLGFWGLGFSTPLLYAPLSLASGMLPVASYT